MTFFAYKDSKSLYAWNKIEGGAKPPNDRYLWARVLPTDEKA